MRTLVISIVLPMLGVTMLPVLLSGGDPPPPTICGQAAGPVGVILATIRTLESGDDYKAQAAGASASGAYQILDSTWNGYDGYTHAKDSPPAIQDAKATLLVTAILDANDDDVTTIPIAWYIGYVPAPTSPAWDTIPQPLAGNRLTPRQYQAKWMTEYTRQLGDAGATPTTMATSSSPGGCIGGGVSPLDGGWSLPGPRQLIDANPSVLGMPHHDYPAWDWLVPTNTPIYAVRGGTVTNIHFWPYNWWAAGCEQDGGSTCQTCGVGVTIVDELSTHWTYCHGANDTVMLGQTVKAGQQIMWSGNTGRSGAPHVHLEIGVGGQQRCPQPLLESLYTQQRGLDPGSLPSTGCFV